MINIFNSPVEPTQLDEFAEGNGANGEEQIFDVKRRKPQITYNKDGRKIIDGVIEETQPINSLWATTISRGVANEWREEATGTRIQKTKRYLCRVTYETQLFVRQTYRRYTTPFLIFANFTLFIFFLYVCRFYPFN